jgi:hypothetical protein
MAANGISNLQTKQLKQVAKLDLSAIKRAENNNPRATYDITQLPTQYNDNDIIDNPNIDGLILGRPWIITPIANYKTTPDIIGSGVSVAQFSPFMTGNSYQFNGTLNSYLTFDESNDWAPGTSDFTIEWFSYQTNLFTPQFQRIFTVGDFPTISIGTSIEGGTFYYWANNTFRYSSNSASQANAWIHWAIVRQSGITKIYKNGTQLGAQITDTNNITDAVRKLVIGNTNTYANNAALIGYLTNFRWVNDLAVYTGNFTIPTSTLTATQSPNPYGGNNTQAIPSGKTVLLLTP